jgi:hypothetical protein
MWRLVVRPQVEDDLVEASLWYDKSERPLNRILHGLVFSRVLFPRIQEFNHGKFKAFLSC